MNFGEWLLMSFRQLVIDWIIDIEIDIVIELSVNMGRRSCRIDKTVTRSRWGCSANDGSRTRERMVVF